MGDEQVQIKTIYHKNNDEFDRIKEISNIIDAEILILFWQFTIKTLGELDIVSNQHLSIEMFLMRLIHLNGFVPTKDIKDDELKKNGIFYKHDEDNLLKGYAMIIGPKNTPYQDGFYFFTFKFSEEYPFVPPIVIFKTYDGFTRFNPNLYIDGKVCLSVLNTWKGEGWSSCQNIRSILLILSTVLNETPIENEPDLTINHRDNNNYNNNNRKKL